MSHVTNLWSYFVLLINTTFVPSNRMNINNVTSETQARLVKIGKDPDVQIIQT